jgi:hypothetical protein
MKQTFLSPEFEHFSTGKDLLNVKIFLLLCGIAGLIYLLWPYLMWMVKVFIYNLILDYGLYLLIFLAGGGYYLWHRMKS